MKIKFLKTAAISVIICIAITAMIGASPDPETKEVSKLLEKRTDIISSVLSRTISFDEGRKQLKTIEAEKIYSNDIRILDEYRDTDYSEVLDMDIVSIEKKSHIYDRLSFACKIEWTTRDYDGIYTEAVDYTIGVSESEDEYRLISMEIQTEN